MEHVFVVDKIFEKANVSEQPLTAGEYERCTFTGCDFTESDFADIHFIECSFETCNRSLVRLKKTSFRDVVFKDCKMLGTRFYQANEFGLAFRFDGCILDHSSFYQMNIKNTVFRNCRIVEADFTQAELTGATFEDCDLSGTLFENTVLEKADLRSAIHYAINPQTNKIKKAKFSAHGLAGLLHQYDIEID
jgi:uncharacterized protein YjbI with pentapeptide repeats